MLSSARARGSRATPSGATSSTGSDQQVAAVLGTLKAGAAGVRATRSRPTRMPTWRLARGECRCAGDRFATARTDVAGVRIRLAASAADRRYRPTGPARPPRATALLEASPARSCAYVFFTYSTPPASQRGLYDSHRDVLHAPNMLRYTNQLADLTSGQAHAASVPGVQRYRLHALCGAHERRRRLPLPLRTRRVPGGSPGHRPGRDRSPSTTQVPSIFRGTWWQSRRSSRALRGRPPRRRAARPAATSSSRERALDPGCLVSERARHDRNRPGAAGLPDHGRDDGRRNRVAARRLSGSGCRAQSRPTTRATRCPGQGHRPRSSIRSRHPERAVGTGIGPNLTARAFADDPTQTGSRYHLVPATSAA